VSLKYKDAGGREISADRWRALFGTPKYAEMPPKLIGRYEVRLTWVGVASSFEEAPTFWFLEMCELTDEGRRVVGTEWFPDLDCALARMIEVVQDLKQRGAVK